MRFEDEALYNTSRNPCPCVIITHIINRVTNDLVIKIDLKFKDDFFTFFYKFLFNNIDAIGWIGLKNAPVIDKTIVNII